MYVIFKFSKQIYLDIDTNGKYNNEKNIKDIILNTTASLVYLVHYTSHMLICIRR